MVFIYEPVFFCLVHLVYHQLNYGVIIVASVNCYVVLCCMNTILEPVDTFANEYICLKALSASSALGANLHFNGDYGTFGSEDHSEAFVHDHCCMSS